MAERLGTWLHARCLGQACRRHSDASDVLVSPAAHAVPQVDVAAVCEKWQWPHAAIKLGKKLGSGNFGDVWKGAALVNETVRLDRSNGQALGLNLAPLSNVDSASSLPPKGALVHSLDPGSQAEKHRAIVQCKIASINGVDVLGHTMENIVRLISSSEAPEFNFQSVGSTPVAVKTLKQAGPSEQATFLDEAALMTRLQHPNVIRLVGICSREEPWYIIVELMGNGCLHDFLRADELRRMSPGQRVDFVTDVAAQVASGMQYLGQQNVVHRGKLLQQRRFHLPQGVCTGKREDEGLSSRLPLFALRSKSRLLC